MTEVEHKPGFGMVFELNRKYDVKNNKSKDYLATSKSSGATPPTVAFLPDKGGEPLFVGSH